MIIQREIVHYVSEMMSEAIKILKGEYTVRAIREHKMDKAIVFCRTKLDCDNMENYLNQNGRYRITPLMKRGTIRNWKRPLPDNQYKLVFTLSAIG